MYNVHILCGLGSSVARTGVPDLTVLSEVPKAESTLFTACKAGRINSINFREQTKNSF
jgi:hypothetical protein